MVKNRTHSIDFKRQVAQDYLAGEPLHSLAKRHDLSRNGSVALTSRGTIRSVAAQPGCHYILWRDRLMQQSQPNVDNDCANTVQK